MANVNSSLIASLAKSYCDYAKSAGAAFRLGLNADATNYRSSTSCNGSSIPGCLDMNYEAQTGAGFVTLRFSATFTPSVGATLTKMNLTVLKPGTSWYYEMSLFSLDSFSAQLSPGIPYSLAVEDKATYPTTI